MILAISLQRPEVQEFTDSLSALPWVDLLGLGILAVFLVLGAVRGLWWQVVRLLGVVAAVWAARTLTPMWVESFQSKFDLGEGPAYGVTWFVTFVGALLIAALLGRIGKQALEVMQLGLVDRFGGALAGALTGLVLHGALLLLVTGMVPPDWSTRTLQGSKSERLLDAVSNRWPLFVDANVRDSMVGPWVEALGLRPAGTSAAPEEFPAATER